MKDMNKIAGIYEEARSLSRTYKEMGAILNRDSHDPFMAILEDNKASTWEPDCMVLSSEDYENLREYARFVGGNSGINYDLIKVVDEEPSETETDETEAPAGVPTTGYYVSVKWNDGTTTGEDVPYSSAVYWWPSSCLRVMAKTAWRDTDEIIGGTLYHDGVAIESVDGYKKNTHSNVILWDEAWD